VILFYCVEEEFGNKLEQFLAIVGTIKTALLVTFSFGTNLLPFLDAPCTVADYTPTWGGSAKPKVIASGSIFPNI
jgi:hypothetical protein